MEEESTNQEDTRGNNLHSHWDTPASSTERIHVLVDTVIDPETNKRTNLVCDFEETRQDTADRDDGELGDVTRDGGSDGTTGDSGKSTASIWNC